MMWLNVLKILSVLITAVGAVRITGLDVPTVALTGDEVRLRCDYEMDEGLNLYSLKWYKDGKEFYRHVPGNGQSAAQRCTISTSQPSLPGVTIDCWASSEREVVLKDVSRATSGEYRCEIIGDHPGFRREERKARLTVYTETLEKPIIQGAIPEYTLGTKVSLNCTSTNREYNPNISWFVNGQPAKEHEFSYPHMSSQRTVNLYFMADESRFPHGQIKVTCRASLGSTHVQNASKTLSIPGLLSPQYYSKGPLALSETRVVIIMLCLLAAFT